MLYSKAFVIMMIFFSYVSTTWYSTEHRICDPLGTSWLPFSGFKIHRQYVVKNLKPPMLHFVSLSHCDKGELDYERLTRIGRETDIEWDRPVCFMADDKVNKLYQPGSRINKRDLTFDEFEKVPKSPHSFQPDLHLSKRSNNINGKFNKFLRKFSSHFSFIEYVDDPLVQSLENLNTLSYKDITTTDLNSLKCFKFSRRKKYALRELMIYAPFTWVGGIFECNITSEDKKSYIASLQDTRDFIKPFQFKCDPKDSIPLFPLLADDVTTQWIEKEKGLTFSQRIPYLYSPGMLDFRYGKPAQKLGLKSDNIIYKDHIDESMTDKLPYDSWYKEVEVNENYNYTENDISLISQAVTKSTNLVNHLLQKNHHPWEWDKNLLMGDNTTSSYLNHKSSFILQKMKNKTESLTFLKNYQNRWNNLELSKEEFMYNSTT